MNIGIIKETKTPSDSRVALPPQRCIELLKKYPQVSISVEASNVRCFKDEEYIKLGIPIEKDLSHCDVLLGVKEVEKAALISNKIYFFFSHTIKEQAYNKSLLQEILSKKIQLVDYETLTNEKGNRIIAFGRWAGIVGAHNTISAWLNRTQQKSLKPLYRCFDFNEAKKEYPSLNLKGLKLILTGTGRVAKGSAEVLNTMNIRKLSSKEFLNNNSDEACYCMLSTDKIFAKGASNSFDDTFYKNPIGYHSIMNPYLEKGNVLINGIYWDNRAPALFTKKEMKDDCFNITTIGDITCDIAPEASIPSTIRPSTIEHPVYGYNKHTELETLPYKDDVVDIMAVDNLPNELPRDASLDFGKQFLNYVMPSLVIPNSELIKRASISTKEGTLNTPFLYLSNYVGLNKM